MVDVAVAVAVAQNQIVMMFLTIPSAVRQSTVDAVVDNAVLVVFLIVQHCTVADVVLVVVGVDQVVLLTFRIVVVVVDDDMMML